jgi:hypothetical protein
MAKRKFWPFLRDETLIELYRARESGLSWRQVGEQFDLTPSASRRAYLHIVAKVVEESSSMEEARKVLGVPAPK